MIEALKFVQGAVARKDYVQALTHFSIAGGFIRGFNGMIALCSPIDLDLEITPKATQLVKAIQACRGTVQLNMTPAGKLAVKSGSYRAFVECTEEPYPAVEPDGVMYPLPIPILPILKKLTPFVADDDSRRWARGILFRGQSAFATNNVVIVEYWIGEALPVEVCIPKPAIQELLRIGNEPSSMQVGDKSITFHYPDGRWLRTQMYSADWPDVQIVLDRVSNQKPFPDGFFQALKDVEPFVNDHNHLHLLGTAISTVPVLGSGASVEMSICDIGVYNIEQLALLEGIADTIDFEMYPAPCLFYGDRVRGALAGMKL